MTSSLLKTALFCTLATGCGDPIKEAQRIEELRVLGARLEVADAPERATPEPGETATATWLLADPTALPPNVIWSMRVCIAEDSSYGVPLCRDEAFDSAEQGEPSSAAPSLTFEVPSQDELAGSQRLAVLAVFCDGGTLDIADDFLRSTCKGAGVVQRASFDVFVAEADSHNSNPDVSGATLELDGEPWDGTPDSPACGSDDLMTLRADGSKHRVTLTLPEGARENRERELDDVQRESLQISQLATLGVFERRFSGITPEDDDLRIDVSWKAPGEVAEPTVASFYFVVRDDRGGTSWLTRSACVEP